MSKATLAKEYRLVSLASRVYWRMKAVDKNATEIAAEAGLNRTFVYDLLTERMAHPRIDTLRKLAGPLDCALKFLTNEMAVFDEIEGDRT